MKKFPEAKFWFNDVHPHLQRFWQAVLEGWDPPSDPTEADWRYYRDHKPDDPMTGYLGFAWSFGGRFFEGPARTNGVFSGSYTGVMKKATLLRSRDVKITCGDFTAVTPVGTVVYLDPPYSARKPQDTRTEKRGLTEIQEYAERIAISNRVLFTEFNDMPWKLLHNFGDTVIRHHKSKGPDGTTEKLYEVVI